MTKVASGTDPGAPAIVLHEINLHGVQAPQPAVAIWSDGRIVFTRWSGGARGTFEHLQGRIPRAAAQQLIRDVAAWLAVVPRDMNIYRDLYVSGGQITTITVRDGTRWRSAGVYGAYEADFRAAASGAPSPRGQLASEELDPPPRPFAQAYQRLLDARPSDGQAFEPYDYDIKFYAPDEAEVPKRASEIAWPRDLPSAPPDLLPERCDLAAGLDGCRYAVDAKYNRAIERFARRVRANNAIVVVNGKRFVMGIIGMYRGERSIDDLMDCRQALSR